MADSRASDLVIALDGDDSEVSADLMDEIMDIREYDVPFHCRYLFKIMRIKSENEIFESEK
jgi:DNA polymerase elongation subunit (family B)